MNLLKDLKLKGPIGRVYPIAIIYYARVRVYQILVVFFVLGLSMGISPIADPEFDRISTITFGFNGNLFVHISEHDYKMYREKLSFDQLCESLASTFIEFLEYYRHGRENRIIVEWKNV